MTRFLSFLFLFFALGVSASLSTPASAGGEPDGFNEVTLAENLRVPTAFAFLPTGDVLILERDGRLLITSASGSPAPLAQVLQVPGVDYLVGERGATAITVDPGFDSNGFIYVWYAKSGSDTMRLSRFAMVGESSDPASEFVVWESPDHHGSSQFHFGGGIEFGPEGKIWFSVGDRSVPGDAQDLTSSSGKIHRINPDGSIPTDNPFYDGAGPNIDSVFTYGLRNPFRIRWGGDQLYVAEVGQEDFEDLNIVTLDQPGQNFGWPLCEGMCQDPAYDDPAWTYEHGENTYGGFPDSPIPNTRFGASVTGGDIYDSDVYPPEYHGAYFFGDYANRWVSYLTFAPDGSATYHPFVRDIGPVVDVRVGPDGAVYYLSLLTDGSGDFGSSGYLRRIAYSQGNQPPVISAASASPQAGPEPLVVTLTAAATDPEGAPLTYTWITGDGAALDGAEVSHVYDMPGPYLARVEVTDGEAAAVSSSILIQVGTPPEVTIESPIDLSTFRAGDELSLVGSSDDPSDQLAWEVVLGHDDHQHPRLVAAGAAASYTVPSSDHSFSDTTWFDIILTATDSSGLSSSVSVRLEPEKVDVVFATSPPGLNIVLDGVQFTSPRTVDTLIGFQHLVEAPPSQISAGRVFEFDTWASDDDPTFPLEDATFTYVVPDQNANLIAAYVDVGPANVSSEQLGMVDPATGLWTLTGIEPFYYGTPGDAPLMGDWDCDGIDTVGMYRSSDGFVYLRDSNSTGIADLEFLLGLDGDVPLAGDFNGDGCDTISIYRPAEGRIYVANTLGIDGGVIVADYAFYFGNPGDQPFAGDFTGDGRSGIGLYRQTTGLVYFTNDPMLGVAPTDASFYFGDPGDRFVAGDWSGDGIDSAGIYRPGDSAFYLRFTNTQGVADLTQVFGQSSWLPVAGAFD